MSILAQLTLTQSDRNAEQSPEASRRLRLVSSIDQQIAAAKVLPERYQPTRSKWIENSETGQRELKEVPVRFTPWWWTDETGKMFLGVRYGNRWLEIKPKKAAIELSSPEALQETLQKLRDAILAGELDTVLKAASDVRRKQLGK